MIVTSRISVIVQDIYLMREYGKRNLSIYSQLMISLIKLLISAIRIADINNSNRFLVINVVTVEITRSIYYLPYVNRSYIVALRLSLQRS